MLAPLGLLAIVLSLLLAERLAELAIDKRNTRRLRERGAVWLGRDGFGLILAAQVLLFALLLAEVASAPWVAIGWWTWPLLGIALLAQVVRYWCITTLGERWSVRVVTVPGAPRVTTGPYRWLPHPNYLVVFAEVIVLPLAFHAWITLIVLVPLKAIALRRRVRLEEAALRAASPATGREGAGA